MDVSALNKRMGVVNARVKSLNSSRQMNIGRLEALQRQLQAATDAYRTKYGVEITPENLDSELARVLQSKEAECAYLEQVFALIDAGDYAGANALAEAGVQVSGGGEAAVVESGAVEEAVEEAVVENETAVASEVGIIPAPAQAPVQAPPITGQVPPTAGAGISKALSGLPVEPEGIPAPPPTIPNKGSVATATAEAPAKPKAPILSGLDLPTPPNGGKVASPPNMMNPIKGVGGTGGVMASGHPTMMNPIGGAGSAETQASASQPKIQSPTSFGAILGGTEFKV